jgi:hypothetical protein
MRSSARGARRPTHVALHANPFAAECHVRALGIGENAGPALAHLFPSHQQIPTRLHALNGFIVSPQGFHLSNVERFEGGVKAAISGANGRFGCDFRLNGLHRHSGDEITARRNCSAHYTPEACATTGPFRPQSADHLERPRNRAYPRHVSVPKHPGEKIFGPLCRSQLVWRSVRMLRRLASQRV